jgi:hypothetical protein
VAITTGSLVERILNEVFFCMPLESITTTPDASRTFTAFNAGGKAETATAIQAGMGCREFIWQLHRSEQVVPAPQHLAVAVVQAVDSTVGSIRAARRPVPPGSLPQLGAWLALLGGGGQPL